MFTKLSQDFMKSSIVLRALHDIVYGRPFVSKLWHDIRAVFSHVYLQSFLLHNIGGFHVTSSPPCWWTVNKRSLISSFCLSTSICSFHHCCLCLPRLHENHLYVRFIPKYMTILSQTHIYMRTKNPIYLRYKQACGIWGHRKSSYKGHRIIPSAKNPFMYDGAEK